MPRLSARHRVRTPHPLSVSTTRVRRSLAMGIVLTLALWQQDTAQAQPAADAEPAAAAPTQADDPAPAAPSLEPSPDWLRVSKNHEVWIDYRQKQVIVGGRICLREGMLEMFACPRGTKEHESIVAVQTPARYVHAALLTIGAQPGPPVRFEPTYQPARGTEINVEVLWRDADGQTHRVRAQEWVKHTPTGEALQYPWVFAGSGFWTDPDGKEQFYFADGGEFICVSNFSTAMLDLPVESSAANETLLFSAFTERIPPRGTPVQLILTPKLDKSAAETGKTAPGDDAGATKAEPAPAAPATDSPPTTDTQSESAPKDG